MRTIKICFALAILVAAVGTSLAVDETALAEGPSLAVGPQYDTAHVYVALEDFDRFVESLIATFGGTKSQAAVINITPTPSETKWQAVFTPGRHLLGIRVQDSDSVSVWKRANGLSGLQL
jgi:hypothetical protein